VWRERGRERETEKGKTGEDARRARLGEQDWQKEEETATEGKKQGGSG